VETEEQREYLSGIGCNTYQGYLFSWPVPLGEFEKLLAGQLSSLQTVAIGG
jgi:EAL domain-containing protein (putative c-di-GMP-specific phosphodiesterase class I)